ncbi:MULTISPECIES: hypothetical protein [Streptomycetaceae]|uniref:DUF4190 domain-containing protein n=1 Tax=Streptantibioticus cattleyicolor (strain ATCC 35852 / DSM 46488 / JCM 4925 / NBRC 14057 / NRRL 8057) TaxID=1003195 RepID=F8K1E7_STREN|nr:hypothetical protein [Streptantibioticus cattleyicolor]AEW97443.1 hypothetical protein SCATT_50720 [Streptantibioticus cattleyicolor NRRL 8057 = DSM 46488]MYS61880.1 DUF4190 domain-containing protein [Streptomyces sp. SID5468]CCB77762.1 putative membrane protein [Streptantibioticus cattleyicolor NRRL 8057 = DSM 46488]
MTSATSARTTRTPASPRQDADGPAVASFVIGLLGTFLFNAVFGPLAIVLACVSLGRGTRRRGRALLGLALGVADIVILAVLIATRQSVDFAPGF